ncbi:MAG TPA: carbohydrate binding domain-containing protein, partial [Thermoguttaceae bacterium]|nr:carbohydrate binding domain-containing protein [Thermoguttaceae bacterium]
MRLPETETANQRWLQKEVLQSRLLDDMESGDMESGKQWRATTWNQGRGSVEQTADRAHDGRHSLRLQTATSGTDASADGGVFGTTSALRVFDHEDWREFNRLSFWVYPDLPGFQAVALSVRLGNDGPRQGRDTHHFLMKNQCWNQIVWEFPDVARDRVTELAFTYVLNGHEPGAAETALFDIDQVELQTVHADHYEGWNVAPGQIAFSHTGYPTHGPKFALASDLQARQFRLIAETTGEVAYEAP